MKRLGIYGGTFSPPHLGHLNAAKAFLSTLSLDELLIMPAYLPPHKTADGEASPEERLLMSELTFSMLPRTRISDYEIKKRGRSYTYLTLEAFSSLDTELYFLVGTDMFLTLDKWVKPEEIFRLATIALVRRENDHERKSEIEKKSLEYKTRFSAKLVYIDTEIFEISSSEIRATVKNGKRTEALLTPSVREFIDSNSLYGREFSDDMLDNLRKNVGERLSERRFFHTLGVERMAKKLASLILPEAVSEISAAALLHDIAKELDPKEQLSLMEKEDGITDEDRESPKLYHSFAAPRVIRSEFPDFATKNVLSSVFNHTAGAPFMSLFDEIIFVADFIEEGREFSGCTELRIMFYSDIESGTDPKLALHKVALEELLFTKSFVEKQGGKLNSRSEEAIKYFKESLDLDKK